MRFQPLLTAVAAAALTTTAQAALPTNTVVVSDVVVIDGEGSTLWSVPLVNGQSIISKTYLQDEAAGSRYAVWGHVGGESVGMGSGTAVVQDYTDSANVTKSNALVLSTNEGPGGGMLYFDTAPNPLVSVERLTISFTVNLVENGGIADSDYLNGAAFAANVFAEWTSVTRFIAAPTGDHGGVFGLTQADGSLFTVASYQNGRFYDIDITLDFTTNLATLAVDGEDGLAIGFRNIVSAPSGEPFPRLTEVFFYQVTYDAIPEPAALSLLGLGGLGLLRRRRA